VDFNLQFKYNDGGRKEAGFKGSTGDCGVRAAAIITGIPYVEVYNSINELAQKECPRGKKKRSNARTGIWPKTLSKFLEKHGWRWVATMKIGSGCKVHLRKDELPDGRLVVRVSKHFTAVIDGVINDTHDPSRDGIRCVYGYWVHCRGVC
jgi:hypothetical protein